MIWRRGKNGMVNGECWGIKYSWIQLFVMLKVHGSWTSLVNQKEMLNEREAQASVWHEYEMKYFDGKKIKTF